MTTKKAQRTPTKPLENNTEDTSQVEPVVTSVEPVIPEEPEVLKPKMPAGLVDIGSMPVKTVKHSRVNFTENDAKVLQWYNGLCAGQKFTMEQAAEALDLPVDELDNSFKRLQKGKLPANLGHITE